MRYKKPSKIKSNFRLIFIRQEIFVYHTRIFTSVNMHKMKYPEVFYKQV